VRAVGLRVLLVCTVALLLAAPALALPAFPGAEGAGANSIGGRDANLTVYQVTNLNDSGTGSLRAACEASGPRVVVFRVAGYIVLNDPIHIYNPYLTIAGQTAPGGGVCLKIASSWGDNHGNMFCIHTHDVIIRYLRLRPGQGGITNGDGASAGMAAWMCDDSTHDVYNVIFDHCSLSWANDKLISAWVMNTRTPPAIRDITIQRCLLSEGMAPSSCGACIGSDVTQGGDLDIHHNLWISNGWRDPLVGDFTNRVVSNLAYNWWWYGTAVQNAAGGGATSYIDWIDNRFVDGPETRTAGREDHDMCVDSTGNYSIYMSGNIGPGDTSPPADQYSKLKWVMKRGSPPVSYKRSPWQEEPTAGVVITQDAWDSLETILLPDAGASKKLNDNGQLVDARDSYDTHLVDEYNSDSGHKQNWNETPPWPTYSSGTPYTDSDSDGMADTWETARFGNLSRNGKGDYDGDGYLDLEEFLNASDPLASAPPVADFSGSPTSGTIPLTVNFTDSSTNTPTSWSWAFGDGGTSTAQNPSHQYTASDYYTVSLTATNAQGQDTETKTDYITANTTIFSDDFESNFDKWTDGGTTDWDRATAQKHAGSYSAHAGSSDNDLISDNINISGYSSITIELWYRDDDIDDADDIYLQLYDGSAYDNMFELGNSTEDTWNYYTTTIYNSGGDAQYFISNFRIKFEGTSIDSGENLWIDDVKIGGVSTSPPSPPVANFTANPTSGTIPLTVYFTDSSTNTPTSWSWTFGDSGTSTAQNPSHQYTSSGSYTVTLTATNAGGSDGETKTNYITASTQPAPVANFSGSPTSGTVPLTVNFTDSSTNTPTSWSWSFGDSGTSTAQNPSHQYTAAGNYTVTLTATNAGGSDGETKTNYITVTVPAPVANFSGTPTSGLKNLAVSFTDSSTNSPTSWSWNFGDSGTSTAQNPSHTYTAFGKYIVTLTATNAGGSDDEIKTNYIAVSDYYPATSWTQTGMCGTTVSGTVSNVQSSDNSYLQLRAGASPWHTGGRFTIDTPLTPSQVSKITVQIEKKTSRTDATGNLDLTLRIAPNWTTYTDVWSAAAFGTSDAWIPDYSTTAVSTYMDSNGVVTLDFGGGCSLTSQSTWDLYLDTVRLKLDP